MAGKKRTKQRKKQTQRRKKNQAKTILISLAVVVGIAGGLWWLYTIDQSLAGDRVEQVAARHIEQTGCQVDSTTIPPTSGCHSSDWEHSWGVQDSPVPDERQVHNLEHGGIMVQYRPDPVPGTSGDYIEDLRLFIETLRQDGKYCKVVLAPYPRLQEAIALTAWGWILHLDEFDAQKIKQFIDDHIGREGPEATAPCN